MHLLALFAEHDLFITDTMFEILNKCKTNWMHPLSKHWHLIDYIIVLKTDLQDVILTQVLCGAECNLDKTISTSSSPASLTEEWSQIASILLKATTAKVGYSSRHHQDWFNDSLSEIHYLLQRKRHAHNAALNNPTSAIFCKLFSQHRVEAQRSLRRIKNEQTKPERSKALLMPMTLRTFMMLQISSMSPGRMPTSPCVLQMATNSLRTEGASLYIGRNTLVSCSTEKVQLLLMSLIISLQGYSHA